jgi:hypothetical protein
LTLFFGGERLCHVSSASSRRFYSPLGRCARIQFSSRIDLSGCTLKLHGPELCAGNYLTRFRVYKNSISGGRVDHLYDVGAPPRCNLTFAEAEALTAIVFFGALGSLPRLKFLLLAFGFCELAEAVGAGAFTFGLRASACGEVREEVGAAGCEHASAEIPHAGHALAFQFTG